MLDTGISKMNQVLDIGIGEMNSVLDNVICEIPHCSKLELDELSFEYWNW